MRTLAGVALILGAVALYMFGDPNSVASMALLFAGVFGFFIVLDDL